MIRKKRIMHSITKQSLFSEPPSATWWRFYLLHHPGCNPQDILSEENLTEKNYSLRGTISSKIFLENDVLERNPKEPSLDVFQTDSIALVYSPQSWFRPNQPLVTANRDDVFWSITAKLRRDIITRSENIEREHESVFSRLMTRFCVLARCRNLWWNHPQMRTTSKFKGRARRPMRGLLGTREFNVTIRCRASSCE